MNIILINILYIVFKNVRSWLRISIRSRCTTLCDKVCQWLVTGQWFSPCTLVSSTNKTDRHDRTEILLKVALNTIKQIDEHTCSNTWTHFILWSCILQFVWPSWLWSHGSWIYNYLRNQCLLPLKLWVRTPVMATCTR